MLRGKRAILKQNILSYPPECAIFVVILQKEMFHAVKILY